MVTVNHKQLVPERWDRLRALIRHNRIVRIEDGRVAGIGGIELI